MFLGQNAFFIRFLKWRQVVGSNESKPLNSLYIVEILQLRGLLSDFGILKLLLCSLSRENFKRKKRRKEGRNPRKKSSFRSENGVKKSVS